MYLSHPQSPLSRLFSICFLKYCLCTKHVCTCLVSNYSHNWVEEIFLFCIATSVCLLVQYTVGGAGKQCWNVLTLATRCWCRGRWILDRETVEKAPSCTKYGSKTDIFLSCKIIHFSQHVGETSLLCSRGGHQIVCTSMSLFSWFFFCYFSYLNVN